MKLNISAKLKMTIKNKQEESLITLIIQHLT